MEALSPLLLHPRLIQGEGPQGFMLRLANANGLDRLALKQRGVIFQVELLQYYGCLPSDRPDHPLLSYAALVAREWDEQTSIWNVGRCRCCPQCLQEAQYWRVGWEHIFFDVCPIHGAWLIDRCDNCGTPMNWRRHDLLKCDCGHHFAGSKTSEAPVSNVLLSNDLMNKFVDQHAACNLPPLQGLRFEQSTRLIRLLGSYGQTQRYRLPQKIQNVGAMDVSWQVTSTASEIMSQWPQRFEHMLHGMLDQSAGSAGQRFPSRFGYMYALLFKRFAEVEFAPLRDAFEDFVAEHWHGPLAKRHKRLSQAMLARATWIPANHAKRHLQVSASRLAELVQLGVLVGEVRLSALGRRFLVLRRDSVQALSPALDDEVDLSAASEMLGLTRARLRTVLPQLFPNARKIEGNAERWAISRNEVNELLLTCDVPAIAEIDDGMVSMDHVLQFWCCSTTEIATLLVNLRDKLLQPSGLRGKGKGLSRLVFLEAQVRQLIDATRANRQDKWSIPEVADMLCIKQEVAYFLIRNGLLLAIPEFVGRREAAMVNRDALEAFRARYVFARDLAKLQNTSPRGLQSRLAEIDIHPVVSPISGMCRQIVYEKTAALRQLFPSLGLQAHVTGRPKY